MIMIGFRVPSLQTRGFIVEWDSPDRRPATTRAALGFRLLFL